MHNARVVNEDLLLQRGFARAGKLSRRSMTVLLEGEARLSAYGDHHWLAPGDVVVVEGRNAIQMRQAGERYASFALEWEPGWLGDPSARITRARLDARAVDEARAIWSALRASGDDAERLVEGVLAIGHGVGACTKKTRDELREDAPPRAQKLTETLDRVLSRLDEQPMMRDLCEEIGVSPRQLNRIVRDYNATYAFNAGGWIDTRNRRRLLFGATFMTAPHATAAYVAGVVGYRSPTAFARALRRAGLPAPSEIAREVERLGHDTRAQ